MFATTKLISSLVRTVGASAIFALVSTSAQADVDIHLQRIDDTTVLLTGTGSLTDSTLPSGNAYILIFNGLFAINPGPSVVTSALVPGGDLRFGSYQFNFGYDAGTGFGTAFTNVFYIGSSTYTNIPTSTPLAGSSLLHLTDGTTFAALGSTGSVYWGTGSLPNLSSGPLAGTWKMTSAVPEPDAYLMLGLGLIAVGAFTSRARKPSVS